MNRSIHSEIIVLHTTNTWYAYLFVIYHQPDLVRWFRDVVWRWRDYRYIYPVLHDLYGFWLISVRHLDVVSPIPIHTDKTVQISPYLYSFGLICTVSDSNCTVWVSQRYCWDVFEQFLVIFIDSGRIGVVWRHSDENLKKLYNFSELYSFGLELYSFYCPAHQNSTSLRVEGFRKLYWPRLFNNRLWLMCCATGVYKTSCRDPSAGKP